MIDWFVLFNLFISTTWKHALGSQIIFEFFHCLFVGPLAKNSIFFTGKMGIKKYFHYYTESLHWFFPFDHTIGNKWNGNISRFFTFFCAQWLMACLSNGQKQKGKKMCRGQKNNYFAMSKKKRIEKAACMNQWIL